MPKIREENNVIQQLWQRQLSLIRNPYRLSLKILRKLVCNKHSTFIKVWESHSKQPILCEDGKLYFNNYQSCFTLNGHNCLPSELYKLPALSKQKKIEDAIIYSGPVIEFTTQIETYKAFFLGLTKDNWLNSYDNLTGQKLQDIYLGPLNRYKFKRVEWETHGENIIVTSIQNQIQVQGTRPRVLVAIAMLSAFPLEFIALLEIDRKIFGNKCNHVNVSEGLLIIGYGNASNGTIHLYNFKQIVENGILYKAQLNKPCEQFDWQVVGSYPAGLPLNCKIKTAPPILFEVKCSDFNLHIGGHPWHYVTPPPRKEGVFQICSLADHKLAENGCLDFPNISTEADSVAFHPDDSGRLIYHAAHSIRFYKLFENTNGLMSLQECFAINLEENNKFVKKNLIQRRTQRIIKKKFNLDSIMACEKSIMSDDYENELDIYAVAGFSPHDDVQNGKIILYDNETGRKIKTIPLDMKMDELSDYTLTMDLETLILMLIFKTYFFLHGKKNSQGSQTKEIKSRSSNHCPNANIIIYYK